MQFESRRQGRVVVLEILDRSLDAHNAGAPVGVLHCVREQIFKERGSYMSLSDFIAPETAAATDHIDHVRTQLPFALTGGAVAAVGFALVGATL